jgi:hypothetical protein
VGHGGALAALDWGSEGVKAAGNGGQWGRRRSGEEVELGKGNAGENEVWQRVNTVTEWAWSVS